jgi:phosphoglycolate phosphatase
MQSTPKTLLFDLDGTLSDPLVGIARSINYALSHFGFPERPLEDLAVHVGPPLDQSFRLITGLQSGFAIESLVAKYRERYGQIGYSENVLYPGIPEVLEQFARTGVTLGLCTSKRADFAEQILELFGLRSYFDFISGGEIGVGKSQQIRALLHEGVVTTSTVMVGDRAVDITAAQQNGLLAAGVLWGYGSRQELEAEKPRYLFASPEELLVLADARLKAKAAQ